MTTRSLALHSRGTDVSLLQKQFQKLGLAVPNWEINSQTFGKGTKEAVKQLQRRIGLPETGHADAKTLDAIRAQFTPATDEKPSGQAAIPTDGHDVETGSVSGRLFMRDRTNPTGVTVRAYNRIFGAKDVLLAGGTTDNLGRYSLSYDLPAGDLNLELRVVTAKGAEAPISAVKCKAPKALTMNLFVPDTVHRPASEYDRLMAALRDQGVVTISKLADLRETNTDRDLSLLHSATGWDARLIALAVIAAQKSAQFGARHDVLYAMLRTGLPYNEKLLAAVGVNVVEDALKKAKAAGIVDLTDNMIEVAKSGYEKFARIVGLNTLSHGKTAGTLSTFEEMIQKSGLGAVKQFPFLSTYFDYLQSDDEDKNLWSMLAELQVDEQNVFTEMEINKLKRQSKLGHLTLNNAALVESIMSEVQPADGLWTLADLKLYKTEEWEQRIKDVAGWNETFGQERNDELLQRVIPPVFCGETVTDRLNAYCNDLASHIASSFPTRVIARQIEDEAIDLGEAELSGVVQSLNPVISGLLLNATGEESGFDLGTSAIVDDDPMFAGVDIENLETVVNSVKRLQRVFRISPSDSAMTSLYSLGVESAHEIAVMPLNVFLSECAPGFVNQEEALSVYNTARRVDSVAKVIGISALQTKNHAVPFVMRDPEAEVIRNDILANVPDIGSLLGTGDFCNCEHCRSVLSPAAYLVDMLDMLDPLRSQVATPLEELAKRRPDLPNLPLTCENTNTVMPYIDIVNEILEYIVANGGDLGEEAAKDTGDASTEDLLAEPQNTNPAAYGILNDAKSRVGLPFDLATEMLRRFSNRFDTPLWKLMDLFRSSDKLYLDPKVARVASTEDVDIQSAPDVVDGVPLAPTNRVLLKNQTDATQNGIYKFSASGSAMTRAEDADSPEDLIGLCVRVAEGSEHAGETWGVKNTEIIFDGADCQTPLTFVRMSYGRASVFMEFLGLSRAEFELFTDDYDAGHWGGLYGYDSDEEALPLLQGSAKVVADRLGISYADLAAVIDTRFVNPFRANLTAIEVLNRDPNSEKQIDLTHARMYVFDLLNPPSPNSADADQFQANLASLAGTWGGFEVAAWLTEFEEILFLDSDPDKPCDFGLTKIHYLKAGNPATPASNVDFLKINLFVRLWKKLGWSIEETDRALTTFLPQSPSEVTLANIGEAFETALIYLSHLKDLDSRLRIKKNSLLKLATFWSDIATPGHTRLYRELFNLPVVADPNSEFDSPLGIYLQKTPRPVLRDYLADLQGALGLTVDEIERILADNELDIYADDNVKLTLANVSTLYRYGLLAMGLGLSVRDMVTLKQLSGLSPFEPLDAGGLTHIDQDHPFLQTIRFVEIAQQIKESPFEIEDLDYLVRHHFDPVGKYRVEPEAINGFLVALRAGLEEIEEDCALPDDTDLTNEYFVKQLEQVLPVDVVQQFMGFWAAAAWYEASGAAKVYDASIDITGNSEYSQLDDADFQNEDDLEIQWDDQNEIQRLVYFGVPTPERLAQLVLLVGTQDEVNLLTDLWTALQPILLDSANFQGEPDVDVYWDDLNDLQHLRYRGTLTVEKRTALLELVSPEDQYLLSYLLDSVQSQAGSMSVDAWAGALKYIGENGDDVEEEDRLDPQEFEDLPYLDFSWNVVTKKQILVCRGFLTDEQKAKLLSRVSGTQQTDLSELLDSVQQQHMSSVKEFYDRYLKASFLSKDGFEELLAPGFLGNSFPVAEFSEPERRLELLKRLFGELEPKLTRRCVVDVVTAELAADPALIEILVDTTTLLKIPPENDISVSSAFERLAIQGVNASYKYDVDQVLEKIQTSVTTEEKPDSTTFNAKFDGYLEVMEAGKYRFVAAPDENTRVSFQIEGPDGPELQDADGEAAGELNLLISLDAGVPYHFTFEVAPSVGSSIGVVELRVSGEKTSGDSMSQMTLYPSSVVTDARTSLTLLRKLLLMVGMLSLSPAEFRYMVASKDDFDGFDPNGFPTKPVTASSALFNQLLRLDAYRKLKIDLGGETEDLIDIFAKAGSVNGEGGAWSGLSALLAALTRREAATIDNAVVSLGFVSAKSAAPWLVNERGVRALWEALQVAEKFGVSAASLSSSVAPATNFNEAFINAQALRNAIKARFSPEEWRLIVQPISDELRRIQRDALVGHILHEKDLATMEKLYEELLIDPGMEPVVQTSRLRLAISSVQLFVQRCLLGLEADVSPSAIDRDRWEWMKQYRVWEANRKIFLYPENWLEPEFRDDKSHIYQELESTLLGGEVTNEKAEEAFSRYMSGLEEIARLEIMTLCREDVDSKDPNLDILHVVGRTYKNPHKYFYRRCADGIWAPWIPVDADIDSDHLTCAVWNGTFHLFWVIVTGESEVNHGVQRSGTNSIKNKTLQSVTESFPTSRWTFKLNWCEFAKGVWTSQSTAGEKGIFSHDVIMSQIMTSIKDVFYLRVTLEKSNNEDREILQINVVGPFPGLFRFDSKNDAIKAWPQNENLEPSANPSLKISEMALKYGDLYQRADDNEDKNNPRGKLMVGEPGKEDTLCGDNSASNVILDHCSLSDGRGVQPVIYSSNLPNSFPPSLGKFVAPFFFQDKQNTLLGLPELRRTLFKDQDEPATSGMHQFNGNSADFGPGETVPFGGGQSVGFVDVGPVGSAEWGGGWEVDFLNETSDEAMDRIKGLLGLENGGEYFGEDFIGKTETRILFNGVLVGQNGTDETVRWVSSVDTAEVMDSLVRAGDLVEVRLSNPRHQVGGKLYAKAGAVGGAVTVVGSNGRFSWFNAPGIADSNF